jgi:dihydrofolate reductase
MTVSAHISISLDGFSTGPNQREAAPFGDGVDGVLHEWMFEHADENRTEVDAILAADAYIMGRNMFGPVRGEWAGDWRGWWGPEPPYRAPVFVLTHHPREPLTMEGGTTFTFVTDGPDAALSLAREAAGGGDIAIAGGASTINQYLRADALDVLHLQIAPVTLGFGGRTDIVRLFDGVPPLRLSPTQVRHTAHVTHLRYALHP